MSSPLPFQLFQRQASIPNQRRSASHVSLNLTQLHRPLQTSAAHTRQARDYNIICYTLNNVGMT